jgi:transcriptional regulator with XRE-family HTH domain
MDLMDYFRTMNRVDGELKPADSLESDLDTDDIEGADEEDLEDPLGIGNHPEIGVQSSTSANSYEVPDAPPLGWRPSPSPRVQGDDTGAGPPDPLVLLGRYLRRSRYFVEKSQQRLADDTGVSQSMISRAERGRAPSMRTDKLVALGGGLGRIFPLGCCPHNHDCAWQPARPRGTPPPRDNPVTEMVVGSYLEVPSRRRLLLGD